VDNSITFKAASKSFSLAGLKCAWYFATDPEMFKQVQFWNRSEVSTLGIASSQAAYAGGEDWLNQCVDYIDGNQKFANDYIKAKLPLLKVGNKPEGTYLAWVDVTGLADKIGRPEAGGCGEQEAAADQFPHRQAGQVRPTTWWAIGWPRTPMCSSIPATAMARRPQPYAHEYRHFAQDPHRRAGQHGERDEGTCLNKDCCSSGNGPDRLIRAIFFGGPPVRLAADGMGRRP